jgi:aspartyl-tRNA(Asn)/glutamyl-tRNA(Gln) amidotransferase subunit B
MRDVVAAEALDLIEATVEAGCPAQPARKWWMTELMRRANADGVALEELPITALQVAQLQSMVDESTINDKVARQVIEAVLEGEGSPRQIVEARGLAMVVDSTALRTAVDDAIAAHGDVADKIRQGKVQAVGALIGAVMKDMKGQADAGVVREMILKALS